MTRLELLKEFFEMASIWRGGMEVVEEGGRTVLRTHIAVEDGKSRLHSRYDYLDFVFDEKGEWVGTRDGAAMAKSLGRRKR